MDEYVLTRVRNAFNNDARETHTSYDAFKKGAVRYPDITPASVKKLLNVYKDTKDGRRIALKYLQHCCGYFSFWYLFHLLFESKNFYKKRRNKR